PTNFGPKDRSRPRNRLASNDVPSLFGRTHRRRQHARAPARVSSGNKWHKWHREEQSNGATVPKHASQRGGATKLAGTLSAFCQKTALRAATADVRIPQRKPRLHD